MNTFTFYANRPSARAAVTTGVKFKDHGPSAPKGERWSTYSLVAAAPTLAKAAKGNKVERKVSTTSKKASAVALIVKMLEDGETRQTVLAKLVSKVGLTAPGASTYYANVKNGNWS